MGQGYECFGHRGGYLFSVPDCGFQPVKHMAGYHESDEEEYTAEREVRVTGRLFVSEHMFDPLLEFFIFRRFVDRLAQCLCLVFAGKFLTCFSNDACH